MPTIFAIDGADDFGFGDFGAYSSSVASLQTALIALGQKVGDATLAALVLDGLIGPKTTAAANRAFAMYVTGAPANLATGTLSQSQVSTNAASLASYVNAELSRRGGAKPAAAVPVPIAPPAALAPALDSSAQIIKWSAIGLGGVVVASLLYYMWRKRQGRPAFAGSERINDHERELWVNNDEGWYRWYQSERRQGGGIRGFIKRHRVEIDAAIRGVRDAPPRRANLGTLPQHDTDAIEAMMDRSGGVADVFDAISEIAGEKAEHLRTNWQDARGARKWNSLARKMDKLAASTKGFEVE